MKHLSKQFVFLMALSLVVATAVAQSGTKPVKEKVTETYSRTSVTFFMGSIAGVNPAPVTAASKIKFSDKYFNHNLSSQDLPLGADFRFLTFDKKRAYIREMLTREGVGRQMVAKWFNRQPDGMMNLDYVHQCGLYNANDQDVKMAVAAKRGDAFLKDAGQNLINKTYVLVLVPNDVKPKDDGKTRSWECQYDLFFYQLVFTPEVVTKFYDVWPYEDDNAEVKKTKAAAFDALVFNFEDVLSRPFQSATVIETLSILKKNKTLEQLAEDLDNRMYDNATFALDKSLEDFRVKVKISRVSPLRAKIGKKEGLKCDQQFFVFQYTYNEATKKVEPVRQAVVRSTSKIVDNRTIATGSSPESNFYQTYGGSIQEGMLMQQRLDFGLSVMPGYEVGGIGGFDLNFMFRTGQFTKVTALYLMIDLGFDSGNYANSITNSNFKYSFFRYSLGLGKGLRLARIVELTPYVQYGIEQTSVKDTYKEISTGFLKTGAMLGINLTHNISLIGQVNSYAPMGDITTKDTKDVKKTWSGETWKKYFEDRSGMSIMGGLRIEF